MQQATGRLWRMRADRFLVGFGSPAGCGGNHEMTVLELRGCRKDLVLPREAVDIDLYDPQIGDRGCEMRIHHRRQMAIKIMRGDVDLERLGGSRDLPRLPHPVPHR